MLFKLFVDPNTGGNEEKKSEAKSSNDGSESDGKILRELVEDLKNLKERENVRNDDSHSLGISSKNITCAHNLVVQFVFIDLENKESVRETQNKSFTVITKTIREINLQRHGHQIWKHVCDQIRQAQQHNETEAEKQVCLNFKINAIES